jgi:hypothetical protein
MLSELMLPLHAYRRLDATALADLLRRGEVTPTEVLETALTAVHVFEPAGDGPVGL